jgi:hypothetical protein
MKAVSMGAAMVSLALTSCASPHLYPICFYNNPPSLKYVNIHYLPRLQRDLQTALNTNRKIDISSSPDARWLIAKTTDAENRSAASVWPRIGCIGRANDSDSARNEADCVRYVRDFVATKNYFAFGNARDAGRFDIWNESPSAKSQLYCNIPRKVQ